MRLGKGEDVRGERGCWGGKEMLLIRAGILATDEQCLVWHDPVLEPGMLFGSLNKHSSFSPEELLIVSFPSLFSPAEQNLCLLRGFGVAAKDRGLLPRQCLERCSFSRRT